MVEQEDILAFLRSRKADLFADYRLVKLGLFGSFARAEATPESDIDLLVEFEPDTANLAAKKQALKQLLKTRFGRDVDLCREKFLKSYFRSQVLNSVIYV